MNEPHDGVLGAHLEELLIVGLDQIPAMARIYSEANTHIAATSSWQGDAFTAHETRSGGTTSRIYKSWTALRDELQDIFGETQTNLNDTATAMVGVVNDYANQDQAAAQGLRDAVADNVGKEGFPQPSILGNGANPVPPPDTQTPILSEDNY